MNDGAWAVLVVVGPMVVVGVVCLVSFGIIPRLTIIGRAEARYKRQLTIEQARYMDMGFPATTAKRRAETSLHRQAEAAERELEQLN